MADLCLPKWLQQRLHQCRGWVAATTPAPVPGLGGCNNACTVAGAGWLQHRLHHCRGWAAATPPAPMPGQGQVLAPKLGPGACSIACTNPRSCAGRSASTVVATLAVPLTCTISSPCACMTSKHQVGAFCQQLSQCAGTLSSQLHAFFLMHDMGCGDMCWYDGQWRTLGLRPPQGSS